MGAGQGQTTGATAPNQSSYTGAANMMPQQGQQPQAMPFSGAQGQPMGNISPPQFAGFPEPSMSSAMFKQLMPQQAMPFSGAQGQQVLMRNPQFSQPMGGPQFSQPMGGSAPDIAAQLAGAGLSPSQMSSIAAARSLNPSQIASMPQSQQMPQQGAPSQFGGFSPDIAARLAAVGFGQQMLGGPQIGLPMGGQQMPQGGNPALTQQMRAGAANMTPQQMQGITQQMRAGAANMTPQQMQGITQQMRKGPQPSNPLAQPQQVRPEDARMQAMRRLQRFD